MSESPLRFGQVLPPARVDALHGAFVRLRASAPTRIIDVESGLTAEEVAALVESVICVRALDELHAHPEHDNIAVQALGTGIMPQRFADVEAHRDEPQWFVRKSVKVAFLAARGSREFMWVRIESWDGEHLIGRLCNTPVIPGLRRQFRIGDEIAVTVAEICDVLG